MRLSGIGILIFMIILIFDIDTTTNLFTEIISAFALIEVSICFILAGYYLFRIISISNKIKKQEREEDN